MPPPKGRVAQGGLSLRRERRQKIDFPALGKRQGGFCFRIGPVLGIARRIGRWPEALESRPLSFLMRISLDEIDEILDQEARGEGSLLEALERLQARYRFLPPEALILASVHFDVPLSQAYSVATFYHAFSLTPRGKHSLQVCMGTACHVRGSAKVLDRLETKLGVQPSGTSRDRLFTLETVNCLGACALGPIVVADREYSGQMTAQKADVLLKRLLKAEREHGQD